MLLYKSKAMRKKGVIMKHYKNIVVALELIAQNDTALIKCAKHMAEENKANIVLVHAIEHIGGYSAYGIGVGYEVERVLIENATTEMKKQGENVGISEEKQVTQVGPAKFLILEEAEKIKADLIVVGSHGRHGLRALLGSTADAVLHGANCDVLAVKLKN